MKKLILKIMIFISGIALFASVLALTPLSTFTFRNHEALMWASGVLRPTLGDYYPNQTNVMDEGSGDLARCCVGKYGVIKKNITWRTDRYGFRNDPRRSSEFQIILVGDSNSLGTGISQEAILSRKIGDEIKIPVYNYSIRNIKKDFLGDLKAMSIKPKIVILQRIERDIPGIDCQPLYGDSRFWSYCKNKVKSILSTDFFLFFEIPLDRFIKKTPFRYLCGKIDRAFGDVALPSTVGQENVLFFNEVLSANVLGDDKILEIAKTIKKISNSLKENGIDFIFVPVPEKESIYYELLPGEAQKKFKNKDFLVKLKKELDRLNVRSVDLYSNFRGRFLAGQRLYFPDDTHWNEAGVELAAKLISQKIAPTIKR